MSTFPIQYAPPPRNVPLSLRVANILNVGAQVGFAIFGFGMIFFWVFTWNGDYSFINFRGPLDRAEGRITSVERTSASEGKQQIIAHHYEYSVAGNTLSGVSYAKGREESSGSSVTVEYDPKDPTRSRIEGMRRAQFGPGVLFVIIFPLVGLAILVPSMFMGLRRTSLLRNGVFATGTLKSKRATNVEVNNRRVFELKFEFTARDGRRCEATARSSTPANLEDEAQEPLLYDPEDPSKAFLLDDAPARPKLEYNGELAGRPIAGFLCLILPILVTAVNALIALVKLR